MFRKCVYERYRVLRVEGNLKGRNGPFFFVIWFLAIMVLFSFTFTTHYANEFHLQVTIYKVTFRHSAKLVI